MPDRETLKTNAQRWGYLRAMYHALMEFLSPSVCIARIALRELGPGDPYGDISNARRYPIRVATRNELLQAVQAMPDRMNPNFIDCALSRGDFCVAAFDDSEIVAFIWCSFGTAPDVGDIWVAFPEYCRYSHKLYTKPAYRGQRIMDTHLSDHLSRARGATHAVSIIETHNYASMARNRWQGKPFVGFAGYIQIGNSALCFRSPGAKKLGFKFYKA